uniref:MULE transposase domain-containing protein n=1 Tax=Lactuca sativa TaxID=4236 RepID=A0A9R1VRM9_LACSA|nr:hypothetical protein LSAT_V11C400194230 [Lactuca sativa]
MFTPPIGFGLAVENNLDCCTWFLMRLKESLEEAREVSFITNIDDVVSSCIDHVFPNLYHVYNSKTMLIYMHTRGVTRKTFEPLF